MVRLTPASPDQNRDAGILWISQEGSTYAGSYKVTAIKHGRFVLLEKLLRWSISPRLRARLLGLFGADIGANVRIYEIQLFNLKEGFRNLKVADDVHIGVGCRLDLEGPLAIGKRSTLSPGVTVLTHQDPGSAHNSKLLSLYPPRVEATTIGEDCWLGTNVVVLAGVVIRNLVVVGAGSVVTNDLPDGVVSAGSPAVVKKILPTTGKI